MLTKDELINPEVATVVRELVADAVRAWVAAAPERAQLVQAPVRRKRTKPKS